MHDNRVEIDLCDSVGVVVREVREVDHQFDQRIGVGGRLSAPGAEHLRGFQPAEHGARGGMIERHRRKRTSPSASTNTPPSPTIRQRTPLFVAADRRE